ncbi:hypothetical protein CR513_19635, partial [Mucuna pruriens]
MMTELCGQFKIKHHNSMPYHPKMNGAVEDSTKIVVTYKDWHDMLPYALHGYRTSVRTSTGETPYLLVYGIEAVLPIEVKIPSLRILVEAKLDDAEWIQCRLDQLNLIEEKQLIAICHEQLYQRQIKSAFDLKVRPRVFKEGDLVLKKRLLNVKDQGGKWAPNYEGPYMVKRAFTGGALVLAKSSNIWSTRTRSNCSTLESLAKEESKRVNPQVSRMEESVTASIERNTINPQLKALGK